MASIKQYRGTTWRAIVRRTGYPTQTKTGDSKRELEIWAAGIESKMGVVADSTNRIDESKALVISLFERFEEEALEDMKGRNAKNILQRLMRDCKFMNVRIDHITPEMVRDWRDARRKQISAASVHREMNTLSGVFNHAIKEWSAPLAVNPVRMVSRFKGADKPRDMRWSDENIAKLIKAGDWKDDYYARTGRDYVVPAFLIGIETAMREGELCEMRVKDFHPKELFVKLYNTKNGDDRDVPLSKKAVRLMKHLCDGKGGEDKIIPLIAGTLSEYFTDLKRTAGLDHLRFHDGRHEAATRLSTKLPNLLELSAVTGHRSMKALKRYYNPRATDMAHKLG